MKDKKVVGPDHNNTGNNKKTNSKETTTNLETFKRFGRQFFQKLKNSKICFTRKTGNEQSRSISIILNTIRKVFDELICERLRENTDRRDGLAENKYGFRKGSSTTDALQKVIKTAKRANGGSHVLGHKNEKSKSRTMHNNHKNYYKLPEKQTVTNWGRNRNANNVWCFTRIGVRTGLVERIRRRRTGNHSQDNGIIAEQNTISYGKVKELLKEKKLELAVEKTEIVLLFSCKKEVGKYQNLNGRYPDTRMLKYLGVASCSIITAKWQNTLKQSEKIGKYYHFAY